MTQRDLVDDDYIEMAVSRVRGAIQRRLQEKGKGTLASRHEILGILEEELYEYKMAVHSGSHNDRMSELEDVAVAAIFGMACIGGQTTDW